jgi:hypothetical protein
MRGGVIRLYIRSRLRCYLSGRSCTTFQTLGTFMMGCSIVVSKVRLKKRRGDSRYPQVSVGRASERLRAERRWGVGVNVILR